MDLDGFDPRYLVTLDELYHPHWAARKRRRIGWLRDVVERVWPHGPPARLIQVTGTNGKGTVSHFLEQGLRGSGRAGSWTGPHVFDYAERFHLDGEQASRAEISAVYRERLIPIQDAFCERNPGESLSFAELGILLALHLFERHGLRWGVMEVGAGGRYTPPIPAATRGPSPRWVPVLMFALWGVGLAMILLNYMGLLPGSDDGGNGWYLIGGLGLILGGIVTATQYR